MWNAWNGNNGISKERDKALEVIQAFDAATGRKPSEHSLLSPRSDDDPLRAALLAKVPEAEATEWREYAKRWWKRHDVETAAR